MHLLRTRRLLALLSTVAAIYPFATGSYAAEDISKRLLLAKQGQKVDLTKMLRADEVCVIPTGIDPFAYTKVHLFGRKIDLPYEFESDTRWYVVALNDQSSAARLYEVNNSVANFEADKVICRRSLLLSTKSERQGRPLFKADQK